MVLVACLAAETTGSPIVTMTSTAAEFDDEVLALHVAELAQSVARGHAVRPE
jgi:hypothetical protein